MLFYATNHTNTSPPAAYILTFKPQPFIRSRYPNHTHNNNLMGKGKGYDKLPTFEDRSSDEENDFVRQHMNSKQMIQQQDQSLDMLGSSVLRLGEMSMNIHDELKDQNKMLDEMDGDLDKATSNLEIVTKKTQDLIKKSGGCMNFFVIVGLSVVVLVLFFLIIYT